LFPALISTTCSPFNLLPRNALLADILKRLGLAERTGRGIDLIFEGGLVYGGPAPDYSESHEESVRVFFPKCEADFYFF
jgi:Predicted transcriptional regulator containing an HTH domain and an uncharacterized domain shared with the mammalian protein Schlafen